MRRLIHNHIGALIAWVLITIIAVFALPNVSQLTRAHSAINLPADTESEIANSIQNHWGHHQDNTYQVVAVFNNGDQALTKHDQKKVQKTINYLKKHKHSLGIKSMLTPNENAATKKQLISHDKSTQLVQLYVSKKHGTIGDINKQLSSAIKTSGLKTYVTGADILTDDFSASVQKGIKKTEVISLIFIFVVLLLVFRSPITPLISILMVGVSFITSFSIVTNLVKHFNFPFSNFTQVFMVIVLFGIGTDYNILLYDKFKENLGNGMEKWDAAHDAQHNAGRTILYSGSSILIGFTALSLAKFSIYQSAVGVAVGVAVLLVVLLTLNPFFMALLGKKMFWPSKKFTGESDSSFWRKIATSSVAHPIISLVLVFAILLPIGLSYRNHLNYDDAAEIKDSVPSKQGFLVVQKHFSKGTAEPATLYIKSNHRLDNERDLKLIDQLTNQIKQSNDVKTVTSVTQPSGSKIKELYVHKQLGTVNKGVCQAQNGLTRLSNGSSQMNNGLSQLSSGSQQLVNGLTQMSSQLNSQLSGSNAAQIQQLESGLPQINSGIQQLNSALQSSGSSIDTAGLTNNLTNVGNQAQVIGNNLQQAGNTLKSIQGTSSSSSMNTSQMMSQLAAVEDQAKLNDQQKAAINSFMQQAMGQVQSQVQGQTGSLTSKLQSVAANIQAAGNADQSLAGSMQSVAGSAGNLNSLMSQVTTLKAEVAQLASASNVALPGAATALQQLTGGLNQVQSALGQGTSAVIQLNTGINRLAQASPQLTSGINKVNSGLGEGGKYLRGLQFSAAADTFYIPQSELRSNKTFKKSINTYLSADKKTAKIVIIFNSTPSGNTATSQVGKITSLAKNSLKGTNLKNSTVAMGGQSSRIANIKQVAGGDFVRTAAIMLVGIAIALVLITRSLLQPVYILGTLLTAYMAALSINHVLVKLVMGRSELTWNTPFFSFIMLIALGVDYSIFLVMRYREFDQDSMLPGERIIRAAAIIGTVVISAAIILSGTFAALIPSGIPTLIEVALTVIIGLIILVCIIPITMPSTIYLTYPIKSNFHHADGSNKDQLEKN